MFIQIPGMILQVRERPILPFQRPPQQGRPSFSETRCTGSGFLADQADGTWWRFPVWFFGPRNQWSKGCLKKIWVKFCSPQPLKAWRKLSSPSFLRHPFLRTLWTVEWSWTIHWHGIWRCHGGCPASRNKLWATGSLRCSCARDRVAEKPRPWPFWNCCDGIPSREYN